VLAFCTSPELTALVKKLHRDDPDDLVRTNARYVLNALRKLLQRRERTRKRG
jgi:hypothetical protein